MKNIFSILLGLSFSFTSFAEVGQNAAGNLVVGLVTAQYTHTEEVRQSVENILLPGAPRHLAYTYYNMPIKRYNYQLNGVEIKFSNALTEDKKMYALIPTLHSGMAICATLRLNRPADGTYLANYDIVDFTNANACEF